MKVRFVVPLLAAAACGTTSTPETPPARPVPAPTAPSATGRVVDVSFHADALGVDKHLLVYLPADYDASGSTRYPVLYYLNPLGGDEHTWIREGDLATVADGLHLRAIIAMPDGDSSFYADWATPVDQKACLTETPTFSATEPPADYCVATANYEQYLTKDVVGYVDAHYRTIADRRGRGIAGASMGGFGALMLAMRHPDEWSAAASHSGVDALLYAGPWPYDAGKVVLTDDVAHWGATVEPIGALVRNIFGSDLANWKAHDPATLAGKLHDGDLAIYLDVGTEDVFHLDAAAQYLHDILTARGIHHAWYIGPGKHDYAFWQTREDDSLRWFVDQLAKPAEK